MPTNQINLRLSEPALKRLTEAARKFKRRSINNVAAEVIERYLDLWEVAEQAKFEVIEKQLSGIAPQPEETRLKEGKRRSK